ncbi:MAG: hypothetical protein AAF623_19410, partial [Planctomycetota bacterium]
MSHQPHHDESLKQPRKSVAGFIFGFIGSFFRGLRDVDVDRVGRAVFDHCTSPKALYVTLFERWWVVATFAFFGGCLGAFLISTSTESYETHGSILIYQKMPTFLDNSMSVPDAKAYDSLFSTHVQLIGSELIIEKAIEHFDLETTCPHITEKIEEKMGTDEEMTFVEYLRNKLNVGRAGSGDSAGAFVITVAFGHDNREECITVVEAILHTYRDHFNQSLLFDQNSAFDLVNQTKMELEAEVTAISLAYREFIKTAPTVWDQTTETNPHQERVKELEKQRTELELNRVALLSRIEIMSQTHDATTGEPLTDIARLALIDQNHIPRLDVLAKIRTNEVNAESQKAYPQLQEIESIRYDELLKKYAEKAEMLQKIGADHPRVTDHQATIDVLERKLKAFHETEKAKGISEAKLTAKQLVAAYVRMLSEEYADVTQRLLFLERKIRSEVQKSHELKNFTIKANQLKTEYERSQKHFESVMDKTTKQHLLKEFGNFIAEIVGHPHKVEVTWPKKPVILGLCTIMGIFSGSFVALALDLIAYTPLRRVFWFLPGWLMGNNQAAIAVQQNRSEQIAANQSSLFPVRSDSPPVSAKDTEVSSDSIQSKDWQSVEQPSTEVRIERKKTADIQRARKEQSTPTETVGKPRQPESSAGTLASVLVETPLREPATASEISNPSEGNLQTMDARRTVSRNENRHQNRKRSERPAELARRARTEKVVDQNLNKNKPQSRSIEKRSTQPKKKAKRKSLTDYQPLLDPPIVPSQLSKQGVNGPNQQSLKQKNDSVSSKPSVTTRKNSSSRSSTNQNTQPRKTSGIQPVRNLSRTESVQGQTPVRPQPVRNIPPRGEPVRN